jgi:hypothetical protein
MACLSGRFHKTPWNQLADPTSDVLAVLRGQVLLDRIRIHSVVVRLRTATKEIVGVHQPIQM